MRTWTGSVTIATDLSSLVVFEFILEEYKPSSAPVLWQGGREGGRERRKGIEGNGISTCICMHVYVYVHMCWLLTATTAYTIVYTHMSVVAKFGEVAFL